VALAAILVILAIWEIVCHGLRIPDFILPPPSSIIAVAVFQAKTILPHAATTALEVLIGILISLMVAVPLSIVMFAHPSVEKTIAPFLVASQAVPVFAIAPLLVVWLGYGIASKVLMAAVIIFFPITVNLLEGFKSCNQEFRVLFHKQHGSRVLENYATIILALGATPIFLGIKSWRFGSYYRCRYW
jgi:putative hydroxymethylpyrimidine transport system permease protein